MEKFIYYLTLPLRVVVFGIAIVSWIITAPIWLSTIVKCKMGKCTFRDVYNVFIKCALFTWAYTSDDDYKKMLGKIYMRRYNRYKKLQKKTEEEMNTCLFVMNERESI